MKSRNIVFLALSLVLPFVILTAPSFMRGLPVHAQEPTTHYVATGGDCGGVSPCYSTIQAAVDAAALGDIIKLAAGTYTAPGLQVIYIDKGITLAGGYTSTNWNTPDPTANLTVLDAENVPGRRVIYIDGPDGATVTLDGLIIQRGYVENNNGGGIYILKGTVLLENSQVLNSSATVSTVGNGRGGGIYVNDGAVTLVDMVVQGNSARHGAGVVVRGGIITVTNSTIQANDGDGIMLISARPAGHLSNNVIRSNRGNGVSSFGGGPLTLRDNSIEENLNAGARLAGLATLIGNTIQNNQGNGLSFPLGGAFTLTDNTIQNNSGTGISIYCGRITLTKNVIRGNRNMSPNRGGGVGIRASTVTMTHNLISHNVAHSGGAMYVTNASACARGATITMNSNMIVENRANNRGGALLLTGGVITAENDVIIQNSSQWEAVHLAGGALITRHWTLADNGNYALTAEGGSATLTNGVVANHLVAGFSGADVNVDQTLFFGNGASCTAGATCANELEGDPKFINPNARDYHIGPGSAAINTGVDAGVYEDMDGDTRPACGGFDLGADEYIRGPGVGDLRVSEARVETNALTATLRWTAPAGASSAELRYATDPITEDNWTAATVLTDTLPGEATMYVATLPYSDGTVYFVLKYVDMCGESDVSANAFWPRQEVYLPIVFKLKGEER